ncbi:protein containing AraC-type transcriptional regulator, N-terminal domain, partial [methanotrophic bacterial endosymbiont of Bathymodiolus sp.]
VDFALAAELMLNLKESVVDHGEILPPLFASRVEAKLDDAIFRLLEILESPNDSKVLGPSIIKEITYRVLTGEQ